MFCISLLIMSTLSPYQFPLLFYHDVI
jgi:hypothetical protein